MVLAFNNCLIASCRKTSGKVGRKNQFSFILFGNSKRESARLAESVPECLYTELSQFVTTTTARLA